jgi:hypothetical protein
MVTGSKLEIASSGAVLNWQRARAFLLESANPVRQSVRV